MKHVTCNNCKSDFTITPDDVTFYERIKVPLPTRCPQCRFQRRVSWRNAWHLFKKKDARTAEEIYSAYPEESPVKIYEKEYWNSDAWDPMDYGREYDETRSFFEQFRELMLTVPIPAHSYFNISNCRFCTNVNNIKNCYFVRGAGFTEDSAYLIWDRASKQSMDSHMTDRCELSYGNVDTKRCYRTVESVDCEDCNSITLCQDCVGCNDCVGCAGLRKQSYCIFNVQYTKEEYETKLASLNLGTYSGMQEVHKEAQRVWLSRPRRYLHGYSNVAVSGDYISESKQAKECYRVQGAENCKYCQNMLSGPVRDCYDHTNFGQNAELIYDSLVVGEGASNVRFSAQVFENVKNIEYSFSCYHASDLFGCVSVQKKQYCILNRQYTKEAYEALRAKIIARMTEDGEYGEFFPSSMSPFPYQVTEAYEYFPLTSEEAMKGGFASYEISKQQYTATLPSSQIPDAIDDVRDNIVNETIACLHGGTCNQECPGAFRVIPDEVALCKRLNIPLPRLCPNCRHYERLALRNPPIFYHRQCAKCGKEIETSYSPDRPEVIYCESCYQQEVV